MRLILPLILLLFCTGLFAQSPSIPSEKDTADAFDEINTLLKTSVENREVTGAVVCVGHNDGIIFEKAYGTKNPDPESAPMTPDTIFDIASLTKVVATAPALMMLVEKKKLDLDMPLSKCFPAAGKGGHKSITIRQLLTHYSGLTGTVSTVRRKKKKIIGISNQEVLQRIYTAPLEAAPGKCFVYSDIGFIILGKIIEKYSGQTLDSFAKQRIFTPLGMKDTGYNPGKEELPRIAASEEIRQGQYLRGFVQDPLAERFKGVTGHAGVFSNVRDLSRFIRAVLNGGELDDKRILSNESIRLMTSSQTPPEKDERRGLGWDINSRYAKLKGNFFSAESFGHTGYTGTSLWIDPETKTYVILLTNRPNLSNGSAIRILRTDLSNIVGSMYSHPVKEKVN